MSVDYFMLWENSSFAIKTPVNPHQPYEEGLHLVVMPKEGFKNAWHNPAVAAKAFELSAKACKIMEGIGIAPWFNIQSNGNWGLLPGATPFFHVHIYGRNKTETWGAPIVLPRAPKTFQNDPMPEDDINILTDAFKQLN